jgi:hypothetical protein
LKKRRRQFLLELHLTEMSGREDFIWNCNCHHRSLYRGYPCAVAERFGEARESRSSQATKKRVQEGKAILA